MTGDTARTGDSQFSDRVLILFLASVITSGVGIINGFVLAGLLGPSGKGNYYLLTLLPSTIMVLIQLGLPQAFGFYAARRQTNGLTRRALVMTALIATPALVVTVTVLLPTLRKTMFAGVDENQVLFALLALPIGLASTFLTGIVLGRQAVRPYAVVSIVFTVGFAVLMIILVGILRLGLEGALVVFVAITTIQLLGVLLVSLRLTSGRSKEAPATIRNLFGYGLPFYLGSVTQFFSYRADVFLIALMVPNPAAPLGYYSMAVSMAELVFFFPNAVSVVLFPRVAGSPREESDRQVPTVCRVSLVLTGGFGLVIAPAATIALRLILPAFTPALPALYILLPGVVALTLTKVLTGYVSGLGMTGTTSIVNMSAFVLNVAINLVLIPRFGIYGAATASLISYSASSVAFSVLSARLSGARIHDFWIPRRSDVRMAASTIEGQARRTLQRLRPA